MITWSLELLPMRFIVGVILVTMLPISCNPLRCAQVGVLTQPGRILLSSIQSSRLDAEGTSAIDLEISSAPEWSKWVNSLNPAEFTILMIWRCGAIKTPTRRYFRPDEPPQKKMCPWCKHAQASARHFFTECSRFSQDRLALLWNLSIAFLLIGGDSIRGAPPNRDGSLFKPHPLLTCECSWPWQPTN